MVIKGLYETPVWQAIKDKMHHTTWHQTAYAVLRAIKNFWCSRLGAYDMCPYSEKYQCQVCYPALGRIARASAADHFVASFTYRLKSEAAARIETTHEKQKAQRPPLSQKKLTIHEAISEMKARMQ